jgi:hypothetical protein
MIYGSYREPRGIVAGVDIGFILLVTEIYIEGVEMMKEINTDKAVAQLIFQEAIGRVVDLKMKAWRELFKAVKDYTEDDDLIELAETYTTDLDSLSAREILADIEYILNLIHAEPFTGGAGGSGER